MDAHVLFTGSMPVACFFVSYSASEVSETTANDNLSEPKAVPCSFHRKHRTIEMGTVH